MAHSLNTHIQRSRHTTFRTGGFTRRALSMLALWRSRRALDRLDQTMLDDIGVTPKQARREARRPVWDVPANWID